MTKLDILGGGPAGLGVGYFARKSGLNFRIYEAGVTVGGNCRTFSFEDFRYDSGAHRLHDKDHELTLEMIDLMGDQLQEVMAPSYIFFEGKLIDFPITPANLFRSLPPELSLKAVRNFLSMQLSKKEVRHFEDYAYQKYGQTISDLFLTNYSKKLWGQDTRELSIHIAGSRLKNLSLRNMITEVVFQKQKAKHLEGAFYYPKNGFGQLMNKLADYCDYKNIAVGSKITRIFHHDNKITQIELNQQEAVDVDHVVSTIPLSNFLTCLSPKPPDEIFRCAERLKFRHLRLVSFFLDKPSINNAATMYFPDIKYDFTRGYEPRNRSNFMSPPGKTSFVTEIPFSDGDRIDLMDDHDFIRAVTEQIISTGLFSQSEIIATKSKILPYAYPVLEVDFEENTREIFTYLDRFSNLDVSGRNGLFEYSWTHNMLRYGKNIAVKLSEKIPVKS